MEVMPPLVEVLEAGLIIRYHSKGVDKPMKNKAGIIINSLLSILLIISVVFNINTYSKIKDTQSEQAELQSKIEELQETIESETEKKDNLNTEISTLQSELENLQSEKMELQTEKEELQAELESLDEQEKEQPVEEVTEPEQPAEQSVEKQEEPAVSEGTVDTEKVQDVLDGIFGDNVIGGGRGMVW